jgi:2-oxoglutarate ferredoxin oxidoreductase subunit alpha
MSIDLTIGIAGAGGDGVILLGELLARSAARLGLEATLTKSFGPQIRGGETSARVRVADHALSGADHRLDALFLFHLGDMAEFASELPLNYTTRIFADAIDASDITQSPLPAWAHERVVRVPFEELAVKGVGTKQAKNMVMAGAIAALYGWPDSALTDIVERRFARHGATVIGKNLDAIATGRQWVLDHAAIAATPLETATPGAVAHYFLSGNEALALGAIAAGCRFMAGYPISPASEILEFMTRELPRFGGSCQQAEDEISAICMAIGASYGGVRAMTATSGPGFSLKQEAIGLATMAELPLVVVDVQRCGPSTGIPTRTEQADLNIALHGSHGDAPRIVLAATSVRRCYDLAVTAFELAERYQTPVILLSDQLLAQSQQTVAALPLDYHDPAAVEWRAQPDADALAGGYQRYSLVNATAVAPLAVPGTPGGEYVAVGIEHDESGEPSSSPAMHQAQTERRFTKLEQAAAALPLLRSAGPEDAALCILTWGSAWGACEDAARLLSSYGLPTRVLAPEMLYPLPVAALESAVADAAQLLVAETNYGAQFYRHLRAYIDLPRGVLTLSRAGGVPISLIELVSFVLDHANLPPGFDRGALEGSLNN